MIKWKIKKTLGKLNNKIIKPLTVQKKHLEQITIILCLLSAEWMQSLGQVLNVMFNSAIHMVSTDDFLIFSIAIVSENTG